MQARYFERIVIISNVLKNLTDYPSWFGIIHKRRWQIFWIFWHPPPPPYRQLFSTIRQQFWPIFDPFPPPNCRRRLWTAPFLVFLGGFSFIVYNCFHEDFMLARYFERILTISDVFSNIIELSTLENGRCSP